MSTDRSTSLQEAIAEYLAGRPFFHGGGTQKDIPIITERIGDVASKIQQTLGRLGVCVVVTTPESVNTQENAPQPVMRPTVVLTVIENVMVNSGATGSRQAASKVADACAWYLHQSAELCGHWLIFTEKSLNKENPEGLAYDVVFRGTEMVLTEPTR